MANNYFDSGDYTPPNPNTLARAADVSNLSTAVEAGFDRVPDEAVLKQDRVTYVADTGAADAYVVALSTAPASYVDGLRLSVKITNANTGACTINVNALGAKSIKRPTGSDPSSGDLLAGAIVDLRYDGTNFQIIGYLGADVTAAAASATAAASSASAAAASATAAASSASSASSSATSAASSATAAAASAVDAAAAVNGVKVSSDDTTPGALETKLLAGTGLAMTTQNGGGNETRTVALDTANTNLSLQLLFG